MNDTSLFEIFLKYRKFQYAHIKVSVSDRAELTDMACTVDAEMFRSKLHVKYVIVKLRVRILVYTNFF